MKILHTNSNNITMTQAPNFIPENNRVVIHMPFFSFEKEERKEKGIILPEASKQAQMDIEIRNRGIYHEVCAVSEDVTSIKVGDYVKFTLPEPVSLPTQKGENPRYKYYQPETLIENDTRYWVIPKAFITGKISDVQKYLELHASELAMVESNGFAAKMGIA